VSSTAGIEVHAPVEGPVADVITPAALDLVARLHGEIEGRRRDALNQRLLVQRELDTGGILDFRSGTEPIRDDPDWRVDPPPPALRDRRVEITGPTDRRMVINALNCGARGFMADFEDANSPSWQNMSQGQVNLADAIRRRIDFDDPSNGKRYELGEETATLLVRPRGWHLPEKHVTVGGEPVAGGLFDFGVYVHANAAELLERGAGPYFYLPKMESWQEAELWRDAFVIAEDSLGLDRGSIRATVLIETIPAAFEMEEILYVLREHSAGLNAGRWDYIFSTIKRFRADQRFLTPDRAQITMTVPFMRAYSELLVSTCHRRGAHAMGGMAALIPSRKDAEANERALDGVRKDKAREAGDGFDGTWVAHPDLVPTAQAEFDAVLGDRPNQVERLRDDVDVSATDLLSVYATPGQITEAGLRANVNVGIQYISSWLRGNGAAAIHGLMEDAATAEISRSQVWQWVQHYAELEDGRTITPELVQQVIGQEMDSIRAEVGDEVFAAARADEARQLFERVALGNTFDEFLTLPAYDLID
jgi:malate synthase